MSSFKVPIEFTKDAPFPGNVLIQATNFNIRPAEIVDFYCDAGLLNSTCEFFADALQAQQDRSGNHTYEESREAQMQKKQKTGARLAITYDNCPPIQLLGVINLKQEDANAVLCMLEYLHPGFDFELGPTNWKCLLILSHKYKITRLMKECTLYTEQIILPNDPAAVLQLSYDLNLLPLFRKSSNVILQKSSASQRLMLNDLDPALRCRLECKWNDHMQKVLSFMIRANCQLLKQRCCGKLNIPTESFRGLWNLASQQLSHDCSLHAIESVLKLAKSYHISENDFGKGNHRSDEQKVLTGPSTRCDCLKRLAEKYWAVG
ncbi:unnamed protein product [Sympodiomycopsis kandeliae]